MARIHGVRARFRNLLRGRAADEEVDEEFRFHVDMEAERLQQEGLSAAEARRRALVAFGGLAQHKETMRSGRGILWIDNILRDVRLASRGLLRSPALLFGALLSIGLAVGLNTAVFSFLNATLYKPLDVPAGDRLVSLNLGRGGWPESISHADYVQYRDGLRQLDGLALHAFGSAAVHVPGAAPEQRSIALVSGNYFQVLGLKPRLGRFFGPDDDRAPGVGAVAVVSDYFWRRVLDRDPHAVGRTLMLNRERFVIVGVSPAGFDGAMPPQGFDVYVPSMMAATLFGGGPAAGALGGPGAAGQLLGRLRPGVSASQARAEFAGLAAGMSAARADHADGREATVVPVRGVIPQLQRAAGRFLFMLMGLVAITLLVAGANVAGLLLARAEARTRELAIQASLGARRSTLMRILLVEALLLVAPGAVLGFAVAPFGARTLTFFAGPGSMRVAMDLSPDLRVLTFALAVALCLALAIGSISAYRATRRDVMGSLRGEAPSGRRHGRLAATVVVLQVALAVPLLFLAAAAVQAVSRLLPSNPGYNLDAIEIMADLDAARYETPAARAAYFDELQRRLLAQPAIASAGLMSSGVFGVSSLGSVLRLPGEPPPKPGSGRLVPVNAVTPEVQSILGLHLLRGRFLESRDVAGAPRVAVATAELCRRLWPGRDPLGATVIVNDSAYEIVGVVADAHFAGPEAKSPYVFVSLPQNPGIGYGRTVLASARARDPGTILAVIRRVARGIDPEVPTTVATIRDSRRVAFRSISAIGDLITACAILTLVLAAIGTYALLSFRVARRTREIGVRMALGARSRDVQLLVVRQGLLLVLLGLLLGLPTGPFAVRVAGFRQLGMGDVLAASLVTVLLVIGVSAVASWLPARRATHVHPATVLRLE